MPRANRRSRKRKCTGGAPRPREGRYVGRSTGRVTGTARAIPVFLPLGGRRPVAGKGVNVLIVAAGGAIGAAARYLLGGFVQARLGPGFP